MSIDRGMDKEDVVHIHNALGFFSFIVLFLFVCLFVFGCATQLAET